MARSGNGKDDNARDVGGRPGSAGTPGFKGGGGLGGGGNGGKSKSATSGKDDTAAAVGGKPGSPGTPGYKGAGGVGSGGGRKKEVTVGDFDFGAGMSTGDTGVGSDQGVSGKGVRPDLDPTQRHFDKDGRRGVGGTKKAGNSVTADHLVATGQINTPSIGPNGVAQGNYPTQDDAYYDYSKAVGDYATRGIVGRAADIIAGPLYDQQEPMSQNPRTYAAGTYHDSMNPLGAAGMAAGIATGIPGLGIVGSYLGDAVGIPHVSYGGYGQPDTGVYSDTEWGFGGGFGGTPGAGNGDTREPGGYNSNNDPTNSSGMANGRDNGGDEMGVGEASRARSVAAGKSGDAPGTDILYGSDSDAEYSNIRPKDRRKPYQSATDILGL